MDPALEIAVARQHRADYQVAIVDRISNRVGQRTRVTYASGAAVADEVETKRVKIFLQSCRFEIIADDLAAGRERGFDPRLYLEPLGAGVTCHQSSGNQHRWV